MIMSEILTKKWYKVQLIQKTKTFKITKQVFNTKSEGLEKGISKGYDILNYKALSKLLSEGWSEYQAKQENASETLVEVVKAIEVVEVKQEFNPEIEEAIRQNYVKTKERKGIEFVKGASIKEKTNVESEYFEQYNKQNKQIRNESAFQNTYNSQWDKYYSKREKELKRQSTTVEVIANV